MQRLLVTPEELARHLDDPQWIVFDTRHDLADTEKGRRAYRAGHIPGAYFLHTDEDLSGAKTGSNGRHPLPDVQRFAATLDRCGLRPESQALLLDPQRRDLGEGCRLDAAHPAFQRRAAPALDRHPGAGFRLDRIGGQ